MNSILLTISNNVTPVPSTAWAGAPVPADRGGFSSILAATRGQSGALRSAASSGTSASVLSAASTKSVMEQVPAPLVQGSPPKKQPNISAAGAGTAKNMNWPVPLMDPSLNPVPTPAPAPSTNSNGIIQSVLPVAASSAPGLVSKISDTTAGNTASDFLTAVDQLRGALISDQTSGQQNVLQKGTPGDNVSGTVLPKPVPLPATAGLSSQGATTSAKTQAERHAASEPSSGPNSSVDSSPAQNQLSAGTFTTESIPQSSPAVQLIQFGASSQPVVSSPAEPMLMAQAFSDKAPAAGTQLVSAQSAQTVPATTSTVVLPDAAVPLNVPPQSGNEDSPPGINTQNLSPAVSTPSSAFAAATAIAQFAPPKARAAASPTVRGAEQNAGAPGTSPSSSVALPASGQTPFSVFFSAQAPGAESAASVLSKITFPAAGSALRDGHTAPGSASSASPQSNAAPGNAVQDAATSISPQNSNSSNNESAARDASATLSAATSLHHNRDSSAANLPVVSAQAAAPPIPPAAPTGAALSIAGQPAPAVDSQLKGTTLPAGAQDGPVRTMPGAPEPGAVVPGPVQVAQLASRAQQSEMRIGMNTTAFGSVEVRTIVHANDVGLIIGSEKGDLRTLLANDIPAITNTLQQQNLRLNSVNFMQGFAFSNNASGGGDSPPRYFAPMRGAVPGSPGAAGDESTELPLAAEFRSGRSSSLSILA